jgi:hypothetical protein
MKRWIPAPASDFQAESGAVLGAFVDVGERVEWVYTIQPNGRRIVTGYDILPILPSPQKASAWSKAEKSGAKRRTKGRSER